MQNRVLKFLPLLILILTPLATRAQISSFRLKQADSLFQAKRYVQSFEAYEGILANNEYTPAMFLKMAFIQEGLDHPGKALYYLNLYYLATHDKSTLRKMEELATRHNLEGYQSTDTDHALAFYQDNYTYFSAALAVLMIFGVSFAYYTRRKMHIRPVASLIGVFVFMAVLFVHINFGDRLARGIITEPRAYIMSGPSAAADVIDIAGEGHRVEITGTTDIWTRIKWDGKTAYIRHDDLLTVNL